MNTDIFFRKSTVPLLLLAALALLILSELYALLPKRSQHDAAPVLVSADNSNVTLADLHLFGSTPVNAQGTTLDIKLTGLYATTDSQLAFALCKTLDGKEHMYRIGEQTPQGATLIAVLPDGVDMLYNGEKIRVLLPKTELSNKQGSRDDEALSPE